MRDKKVSQIGQKFSNKVIWTVLIGIPFILFSISVFRGAIPFWYDPARDFLLAVNNISNITFIGPPSGIPGVFYGPYWIWLISGGVLITKDPRLTSFLIGIIPYTIIFPLILVQFSKYWNKTVIAVLWILFVTSFAQNYATYLWNPHIAPILFLAFVLVFLKIVFFSVNKNNLIKTIFAGLLLGFIVNFHISFGIGALLGTIIWLVSYSVFTLFQLFTFERLRNCVIQIISFGFGISLTFLPFAAFEIKNGFPQIKTTIATLTAKGSVVQVTGLTDKQILEEFGNTMGKLLRVPSSVGALVIVALIVSIFYLLIEKKLDEKNVRLATFLIVLLVSYFTVYITSKNPVWEYHFIGIEIIFLLLIGIVMNAVHLLKWLAYIWGSVVLVLFCLSYVNGFDVNPLTISTLSTKEYVVHQITHDAKKRDYSVFIYDPAIYSYDYSYIFTYLAQKPVSFRPEEIPTGSKLVYVILPKGEQSKRDDFVEFRTPSKIYHTTKTINIPDGTIVLRREKISEK